MIKKTHRKGLIIFVREPELGKVKRRLVKGGLPADYVLELYQAFIRDVVLIAQDSNADKVFIYIAEKSQNSEVFNPYTKTCTLREQEGEHLGERMYQAMLDLFLEDFTQVVLVGSDCLTIKPLDIREAYKSLHVSDGVLGPTQDGGYYLIGLNEPERKLFEGFHWGMPSVLADTQNKAQQLNLELHLLDQKQDIDTIEDLNSFLSTSAKDFPAPNTRKWLSQKPLPAPQE